jgi:hypothetical protein
MNNTGAQAAQLLLLLLQQRLVKMAGHNKH